jgi:hypothetical protein
MDQGSGFTVSQNFAQLGQASQTEWPSEVLTFFFRP